jgi:N-acetylneuraminate synthase/N,N'-diacetyllegionaminate synthase
MIIAEAGVNHNGSFQQAKLLCMAARVVGADAVKFQTWITDKIMTPDNPRYAMIKSLEMPFDFFRKIKAYCDEIGIMFLSTPDDEESLDFLVDELDMPIIKIGSGNAVNFDFIDKAIAKRKPLIISTGMCTITEFNHIFRRVDPLNPEDLTLLHCVSLYPADYGEVDLNTIPWMIECFHECRIGLSDHTPGIEIPIAAVAMGATVIEKHLTLDRTLPGPDHAASLEPAEFKQMVQAIRNVEKAMGSGIKQPCEREMAVRDLYRLKV